MSRPKILPSHCFPKHCWLGQWLSVLCVQENLTWEDISLGENVVRAESLRPVLNYFERGRLQATSVCVCVCAACKLISNCLPNGSLLNGPVQGLCLITSPTTTVRLWAWSGGRGEGRDGAVESLHSDFFISFFSCFGSSIAFCCQPCLFSNLIILIVT